jgi:DNA polymerase-3 subunit epsilon
MVFVDLETTGANFARDRIIEIGLVEVDRDGVREWSTLVDPGRPILPFITELTGIDTAMVETAPAFALLAPEILERLRGRVFIAHNARFDYGFLKSEFKRIGIDFRATNLCTVKLSRALFPGHRRHNLDTLVARHGIVASDRHRALGDARVLWELWQRWHALLPADTIRDAVARIVDRPKLPPQIDPALLDDLPEAPGAYAVFDKDGALRLAKRATNLRRQVFAYFSSARPEACRVEWREAAGELGARLYELEFSTRQRSPSEETCSWRLTRRGDGGYRPVLALASEIDFSRTEDLFGLYRSPKEAVRALNRLAEACHLCRHLIGLDEGHAGEACPAHARGNCRGACVGKESVAQHSLRLMSALARLRVRPWPYPGPIALIESDEFGMREDAYIIRDWAYLGRASDEATVQSMLEEAMEKHPPFDTEIYRLIGKYLQERRLRIIHPHGNAMP